MFRTSRRVKAPVSAAGNDDGTGKRPRTGSKPSGPGLSSCMGQRIGEIRRIGAVGFPSRMVSRNPCRAGTKVRRFKVSPLTTLMPILMLIRSAGESRIIRATNWSRCALPPSPSEVRSRPSCRAAITGHTPSGESASDAWLIELP